MSPRGIPVDQGSGIFNGDLGKILEINDFSNSVRIEFDDGHIVDYPYANLENLSLLVRKYLVVMANQLLTACSTVLRLRKLHLCWMCPEK